MSVPDRKVMEAILLLADEPVSAGHIGEVLERSTAEVQQVLIQLAEGGVSIPTLTAPPGWSDSCRHTSTLASPARPSRSSPSSPTGSPSLELKSPRSEAWTLMG